MGKLVAKAVLAYLIGAMFGAVAALVAVEYNWSIVICLLVAMVATLLVDFTILRAEF